MAGPISVARPPGAQAGTAAPALFPVSERKLLVMSLLTLSLYQFYWFYRNWQIEKQREHPQIMPVWRSLLVYFFCYPLFKRIAARGAHRLAPLPAGWLAVGWIITSLMAELPPPYLLGVFFTGFFLLPVQRVANAVNTLEAPGHDPNDRLTAWNVLWICVSLATALLAWLATRSLTEQLGL
jgi:hypothetical protein